MKSAVETVDATKVKLTVEVPCEELKPNIDHAYAHIAQEVNVPGFRKGKVPARIIDQRVGRATVLEHAINDGMAKFYGVAMDETDLRPLAQPDIQVTGIPNLDDWSGELTFTAEVEVRPEITLPDVTDITLTVDPIEVTDADIAERLDQLRERFGTLVGVDRPAADGDFVVLDLTAIAGGEQADHVSGISYQIGSGTMLEGLDEALTGLSAGETTTFTAPLAGGDHKGEQADITVVATSVKQRDLPTADDDFAQLASEFDTLDELKADLHDQVARTKLTDQAVQARDLLFKALVAEDIPVPPGVIQAEVARHLEGEGMALDDPHGVEVTEQASAALRQQMVFDLVADQFKIQVSNEELLDYLVNASRRYDMDPQAFIESVEKAGQLPAMVAEVSRSKAVATALRHATVKDTNGAEVDLTPVVGSDANEAQSEGQSEEPAEAKSEEPAEA